MLIKTTNNSGSLDCRDLKRSNLKSKFGRIWLFAQISQMAIEVDLIQLNLEIWIEQERKRGIESVREWEEMMQVNL